jgi:hypothetical protein
MLIYSDLPLNKPNSLNLTWVLKLEKEYLENKRRKYFSRTASCTMTGKLEHEYVAKECYYNIMIVGIKKPKYSKHNMEEVNSKYQDPD